jgi:hypothetical protein
MAHADTRVFSRSERVSAKSAMVRPLEMLRAPELTCSTAHSLAAVSSTKAWRWSATRKLLW